MVAKIISGKDIKGAINYNEQKVMEGKATLLLASGFLKAEANLTFYDKVGRFTNLHKRNHRTKTNTLHISLNFDPSEKLSADVLNQIAAAYMTGIGFQDQPYLVYEHKDAAHPHIHIVTSIIQESGKRINIRFLGKNQSETARKQIEHDFALVKASAKSQATTEGLRPAELKAAEYGKSETRRTISNIVRTVTRQYKFTSLPELNAILRHYNIKADRGSEKSNMFEKKGLVYSIVDQKGKRIGIPVKASSIYGKPTLPYLEKQFKLNEVLRQPHREFLKNIIDETLKSSTVKSKTLFAQEVKKKGIDVVFRTNDEGRTFGITFVDHHSKTVFNGSAIGKAYSASEILARIASNAEQVDHYNSQCHQFTKSDEIEASESRMSTFQSSFLKDITTAEVSDSASPEAALRLGKNKRKRKKRRL